MNCNRRQFMKTGLSSMACFSTASTMPLWIARSAQALGNPLDDRILVIYQMAGGNDGLNTVIPYSDPKYLDNGANSLRPTLHITSGLEATELGDGLNALHPKLVRLKNWYSAGKVAIVQNVGYPNPSLSHFTGTDYWELGVSPGSTLTATQGWASRYYDNMCNGAPPPEVDPLAMMAGGMSRLPLTLSGSNYFLPPAVESFESYNIEVPTNPIAFGEHIRNYIELMSNLNVPLNSSLDYIQRAANIAQASVEDMQIAALTPIINPYPSGSPTLGPGLDMVSRIIRTESPVFKTRVFYVTQGGYDTHANQSDGSDPANNGTHPQLLDEMDRCLDAFLQDMADSGNLDRVLLLTFSEFGRRPQENGSNGTDHGTASCLFAMGGGVNGGVYGGQPNLAPLTGGNQGGNLEHAVDFRSVYSIVLRDWLQVDPALIFGPDFTNPAFNIAGGMGGIEFIAELPESNVTAVSKRGLGMAAILTALAGGAAVQHMMKDEQKPKRPART
ncbi:MAG: DUF1501 domain-containing protein [Candidatus Hydrogenedentes bacterium]|nr:DUF1501 domain-containing protein [Candidatus Hydrogenedentota bacterium]